MLARRWTLLTAALAILAGFILSAANLRLGDLNQDEGWYLLAARSVSEGKLPYRDFAFTQGPMLPVVYSLAQPLVAKFGVAGGRAFTMALGVLAALFATYLAGRIATPRHAHVARAVALTLIALNVYHSYFTTIVKTYSLCALFLAAGFFVLSFVTEKRGWTFAALGGLLLAAAAATRISSGAALAVTGLVLLFNRRRLGDIAWLSFGIGGVLGLALFLGPWFLIAPVGFKFGIFEYHTMRSAGDLMSALIYKAGFIARVVNGWLVAVILTFALIVWTLAFPKTGNSRKQKFQSQENFDDDSWTDPSDSMLSFWQMDVGKEISAKLQRGNPIAVAIWISGAVITLVHFIAPFPYDDYQVPLFPLLAAALAAALVRTMARLVDETKIIRASAWLLVTIFLGSALAAGSSPSNMDWFVRGRDRIWWRMKDVAPLALLHHVGEVHGKQASTYALISDHEPNVILTQDAYLAVEAGLKVPPGLEMGPFSYFPEFSDERAKALHVLNRNGLRELLKTTKAPMAAMSGYGLSIACPEVSEIPQDEQRELQALLDARYNSAGEIPNFGQGATTLKLYQLRDVEAAK